MKKVFLFFVLTIIILFGCYFTLAERISAKPLLDQIFGTDVGQPIEFTPNLTIPGSQFVKGDTKAIGVAGGYASGNLAGEYFAALYKFLVGSAGIIAVLMIMIGGFQWLFSGGSSDKITKAKETIFGAAIGLMLALGSYLILYTINPQLVDFSLAIKTVPLASTSEVKYCSYAKFKAANAENFYGNCGFTFNLSIPSLVDQKGCIFAYCSGGDEVCVRQSSICDEENNCTQGIYSCKSIVQLSANEDSSVSFELIGFEVDGSGENMLCGQASFNNGVKNMRIGKACDNQGNYGLNTTKSVCVINESTPVLCEDSNLSFADYLCEVDAQCSLLVN